MLTTIIVTVILGAIIGALARLVLPGKQNISTLMTVILGIVGALIGSWLWTGVFNKGDTSGIDWIALIMGVIVAAVLIVVYERVRAGRTTTRVGRPHTQGGPGPPPGLGPRRVWLGKCSHT